jgi:hypothetical protein
MKFMVMVRANKDTEAGVMPTTEEFAAMGAFNEELAKSVKILAGEGLQPTSKGARIRFEGDKRFVIDGPFTESKELIAGFWMIEADSKAQVIELFKRCPNPTGHDSELEIRQVFEAADFGEAFTPELQAQEERWREQAAANQG